jgi:hypothetical protein
VAQERVVDLERRDLLPAPVDDLLQPAPQCEIALVVQRPLVAGAEPAVREGGIVRLRVRLVAREDVRAADGHLADLPR